MDENKNYFTLALALGGMFTLFYLYNLFSLGMAGYKVYYMQDPQFSSVRLSTLKSIGIASIFFASLITASWISFFKKKYHLSILFSFLPVIIPMTLEIFVWGFFNLTHKF